MPRKPVVTLPTDFFETGNVRALCMKKGGEEALIVYLHLLCMAVKQDREGKLMLYDNIPLDDATIARLMYKTEKSIETSMKLLMDFHLIALSNGSYYIVGFERNQKKKSAPVKATTGTKSVPPTVQKQPGHRCKAYQG